MQSAIVTLGDPVAHLALALAVLLVAGRAGGELAVRLGQPQVLGELVAGIALAALPAGSFVRELRTDDGVDALARLGAIVLLFETGLALKIRDVLGVGASAARVAVVGTVASFAAGIAAAKWLLPDATPATHVFVAAALTATSVGISARVLRDLGRAHGAEARTVLAAAVLDDVIGLILLSIVTGVLAERGAVGSTTSIGAWLIVRVVLFLGAALVLGAELAPRLAALARRSRTKGAALVLGLALCFFLSWAADAIGLAPIIGAFTAGLIVEDGDGAPARAADDGSLARDLAPIAAFLVPPFFVLVGLRTDLAALAHPGVVALALGLGIAALLGKLACGLAAARGTDRLAIAFGMMPRGEVTLLYATLGATLVWAGRPVVDPGVYSALMLVVVVTTVATPFGLRWRMG